MEELDLKGLVDLFISKIFQILLIIIIAVGIGVVYTIGFTVPKYSSSTTLVLTGSNSATADNSITTADITLNSKLVATYSQLIKSNKVLRQVTDNLNLQLNQGKLKKNISVTEVEDAEMIRITVTNENPEVAAKVSNEIAKVFCSQVAEIYGINNVHILDEAEASKAPSNINHTKDVIIFFFIGVVVAIAYVLVLNMFDTTVKTAEDIEKGLGLPVLVSIPLMDGFTSEKGGKK